MSALHKLQNNKNLIGRSVDKGGAIVMKPRDDCIREASEQLANITRYKHISNHMKVHPLKRALKGDPIPISQPKF